MTTLLAAVMLLNLTVPLSVQEAPSALVRLDTGWAYHYSPGIMNRVLRNRHMKADPTVDAYVSTPYCELVNPKHPNYVWFRFSRTGPVYKGMVADCTNPIHQSEQNANALRASRWWSSLGRGWVNPRIALELDWNSAKRLNPALVRTGKQPVFTYTTITQIRRLR